MDPSSKKSSDDASDPRVNPYAPPAAAIVKARPRRQGGALRSLWVWCYAAVQLVAIGTDIAYLTAGVGSNGYGLLLRYGSMILGLAWLGSAYERLPQRLRLSCSPGALIGRHFIPVYNLYWIFKAQTLLCEGLDALLVESGRRGDTPRALASVACSLTLVARFVSGLPGVLFVGFMLVLAGAWTMYMIAIEERLARASEGPAPRVCDGCAHDNEVDATFCSRCGGEL
jgi:hypothetical protein